MGFVRRALGILAGFGVSAALAASAPPPPFKTIFPETNKWSFACFCGAVECTDLDPITDYCVAYQAKSTRSGSRMVLFALKTMVIGREPKYAVGFGVEKVEGVSRAQVASGGAALAPAACASGFCYTPVAPEQIAALGDSPQIDARAYIGGSSVGTAFNGAGAKDLFQKLITLPQHN
ncbi:MAG: hypothetical protein AB7I36_12760 [Rhodospirillaceae bacterium]